MTPLIDAAIVLVGGRSNVHDPGAIHGSGEELPAQAVGEALTQARRAGARLAVFVGGEPTARRDLQRWLVMAERLGLESGLATNGRMLLYPRLRSALCARELSYLRVALHGAEASTHDALVRVPGAFEQTWEGLGAILAEAPETMRIDVACTVTSSNLAELEPLSRRLTALPRRASLSVRFVAPTASLRAELWPAAEQLAASVGAALDHITSAGTSLIGVWEGFPPCLLPAHAPLRDETLRYGAAVYGDRALGASIPLEQLELDRHHPFPCQDCLHEATCPGAPRAFLERDGEEALRSERAVRANSFNYEWRGDLPDATLEAGACSVPGLSLEGPLARNVVLSRGGKCSLYHSPTSDFTDEEVRRVKDDLMQIYFDIMDGAALNDFMNSMRRAIPHPECVRCPDRPSCCGAVVVDEEPAFRREERWLRKEVSRMRGRVLDVGCGEQPYRDIVAELIAAEQIEYHGLDPHLESLEAIRASGMGGTLYNQGVEQFECEEGYFDYVLGLRSLNHFNDMLEAFRVIARAMRVGGQLVLCDSPPFAMLRTPNQVRFADTNAPFGHEHFRNWTSEQVVEFLKRFPFRVDVHRPVSSRSSNQWIVKLVRV